MIPRISSAVSLSLRRPSGLAVGKTSAVAAIAGDAPSRSFYVKKTSNEQEGNVKTMKDDASQLKESRKKDVGMKAEKERGSQPSQAEGDGRDMRNVPSGAKPQEQKDYEKMSSQQASRRQGVGAGAKPGP